MAKKDKKSAVKTSQHYPPVVVVLGHVDHGKTTLLDAIRKTNIAQKEHGLITQKIGASIIEVLHEKVKRIITFIDTPGHEAFSQMRSRGATVADIGLLVVSSTEGIKPQTKESIQVLKEAGIPFIAVLTKSDLPTKNPEKVKQELMKEEIQLEGFGGDVPVIEVSATKGANIKELLDLILLVHDMRQEANGPSKENLLKAVVIESRLDSRLGPLATLVVKDGELFLKDELATDNVTARVRAIINDKGERLESASVGLAAEILGFDSVPDVGSIIQKKSQIGKNQILISLKPQVLSKTVPSNVSYFSDKEEGLLSVILVVDNKGSLEAILTAFPKKIEVISQKTGEITEADVLSAKSIGAIILGFNTKIRPQVQKLAREEKVPMKNYTLIYELLDEVREALAGKQIIKEERILGLAKVLAEFPYEKTKVLGIKVIDGRIAKGDRVRIEREESTLGESTITSLRQGKTSVSKIEKGEEAGVILSPFLDFAIGDVLISHA